MSFFVDLSSNVQALPGCKNTVANFTTKLRSKLDFASDYEVAIVSVSYPKSWYNIEDEKISFANGVHKPLKLSNGYYYSAREIVDMINSSLKISANYDVPKFFYDSKTHVTTRTFSSSDKPQLGPILSKRVRKLIGYYDHTVFSKVECSDIHVGYRSIFVYSNIVNYSYVGDSLSQLLRVIDVPPQAEFGEQITINFSNLQYRPLFHRAIDQIEIVFKSDTDDIIPFQIGRSYLTLHFRPVQNE